MAIYQIKRTDGGQTITIAPGQLNGPSGTSNITDLDLYGQGTLNWGKGVDQNQLRLLENFACPQSTASPLRPVNKNETTAASGFAGQYIGDSIATGINKPVKGQLWHNTTNNKLYVCTDPSETAPVWQTAGADPDLFLALTGGTLSGNIAISKSSSEAIMSLNSNTTNKALRYEMRVNNDLKGMVVVDNNSNDTLILRKEDSGDTITDFRIQNDGIDVVKGSSSLAEFGAGTIRISETITALHPGNTLITKDYMTLAGFVQRIGDTMTGNLNIYKSDPTLRLDADSGTAGNNPSIDFRLEGNLRAQLYVDQEVTSGTDHLTLAKKVGSVTQGRIVIENDRVLIKGADGVSDTSIWTTGDGTGATKKKAGQIATPTTEPENSGQTLTTKNYVDSLIGGNQNYVALGSQANGMTGRYRFGVNNADTVIDGASFKSLNNSDTDIATTILGNAFKTQTSSTIKTEITSAAFKSTNGSGILEIEGSSFNSSNGGSNATTINQQNVSIQASTGRLTTIVGPHFTSNTDQSGNAGNCQIHGSKFVISDLSLNSSAVESNKITQFDGNGVTTIVGHTIQMDGSGAILTIDGSSIHKADEITHISDAHETRYHMTSDDILAQFKTVYIDGDSTDSNRRRASVGYNNGTDPRLYFIKYDESNSTLTSLATLNIRTSGPSFESPQGQSLKLRAAQQPPTSGTSEPPNFGVDFEEQLPTASTTFDDGLYRMASIYVARQVDANYNNRTLRIDCNSRAKTSVRFEMFNTGSDDGRFELSHHVRLKANEEQINNARTSQQQNAAWTTRTWHQSSKPAKSDSASGDIWVDTNAADDAVYMRVVDTWYKFIKDTFDDLPAA